MKYEISGNIYGMKLRSAEIVFASVSYKAFLLRYSAPGASYFSIWICRSRLLSEQSANFSENKGFPGMSY